MNRVLVVVAAAFLLGAATTTVSAQESLVTGIDTDITGNDATTVGQINSCIAPEAGATFSVDVFIQNIPALEDDSGGFSGGLSGFSYSVLFDPAIVEITGVNSNFLVTTVGEPAGFGFTDADAFAGSIEDPLPATTGNLSVDYGDLTQNYEDGDGVLSRLDLLAKAPGETALRLLDWRDSRDAPRVYAASTVLYPVGSVHNALVVVDGQCEAAAPTPYSPPDGGARGSIDNLDDVPTSTPTDAGESATPTPAGVGVGSTRLAVDILPAGNEPTVIDAVETCAAASVGDVFRIDIVIEGVEDLLAWEIALSYDPEVLTVEGRDVEVFQDANSGSRVIDVSAATPDSTGRYVLAAVDSADPPSGDSGDGVLAHLTMMAIGKGTSPVTMTKLDLDGDGDVDQGVFLRRIDGKIIGDEEGDDTLFDGPVDGAEVRVEGECPGAPDARVQLVLDTGEDGNSSGADDDDGVLLLLIIIGALAAIVLLAGGLTFFIRRRAD